MLKYSQLKNTAKVSGNHGFGAFFRKIMEWKKYLKANPKELEILAKGNGKVAELAQVKLAETELLEFYQGYLRYTRIISLLDDEFPSLKAHNAYIHYGDEAQSLARKMKENALDGKLRDKLLQAKINGESLLDCIKRTNSQSSRVSKALLVINSPSLQSELLHSFSVLKENEKDWDKFVRAYVKGLRGG